MSSRCERQKNMKLASTAKLPKKTSAKVDDPDNPAWTEDMLGAPALKRGRDREAAPTKVLTSIRLDADVLAFFKSQGSGYQSRINDALRSAWMANLTDRSKSLARKRKGRLPISSFLPANSPGRSAAEVWAAIPSQSQRIILASVYCSHCRRSVSIETFESELVGRGLVLRSSCPVCGGKVARHLEEVNL